MSAPLIICRDGKLPRVPQIAVAVTVEAATDLAHRINARWWVAATPDQLATIEPPVDACASVSTSPELSGAALAAWPRLAALLDRAPYNGDLRR